MFMSKYFKEVLIVIFVAFTITVDAQVTNGAMEDIVTCGDPVEWSLITTGEGTVVIRSLPPGVEFVNYIGANCNISVVSSSPPTFYVASACTIRYSVAATCESYRVRDPEQGGNPNEIFKVQYNWNGNNLVPQDIASEINAPELNFEVVENGSPATPFEDFQRVVRVCNDGLDSYIKNPLELCFENGSDLLLQEVRLDDGAAGIVLNVVGDCVTITVNQFQHARDRNNISSGSNPNQLEGSNSSNSSITGECITLNLTINLDSCEPDGEFTQNIMTNWGCDGEACAIAEFIPINANISDAIPYLNIVSKISPGDGCNLDHMFSNTFTIRNTGQGAATNVMVHIEPVGNFNTLWAFDINRMLLDDGTNAPYSIAATTDRQSTFISAYTDTEFCFSKFAEYGGTDPAVSFDFTLPISLEPGQSIDVIVPMFFCCPKSCRQASYFYRWQGSMTYSNSCGSASYNLPNKLLQNWFAARMRSTPTYESNINDLERNNVTLNINDFYLFYYDRYGWDIKPYFEITLPCGLNYVPGAVVLDKNDVVNTPSLELYDPITRVLRLEWEYPFQVSGFRDWKGGKLSFDYESDCSVCGGGSKRIQVKEGYILGTDCEEFCTPHRCYNFSTTLACGGCPWPGITPKSYDIARINYGFTDLNDDGLPDDGSIANPADIRLDRAVVGDTIEGKWYAVSTNNDDHPAWEYAYARATMSGMSELGKAVVIAARIKIYDSSTGDTLVCDQVPFVQTTRSISDFDFSPSALCNAGCFDICNFAYEDGDEIWLSSLYTIKDNNVCVSARLTPVSVRTELYGAEVENPASNSNAVCAECDPIVYPDNRWTCSTFSDNFELITPFVTQASSRTHNFQGCRSVYVTNSYYWGVGPGSSYHFNMFSKEYRPFGIFDTIYMSIPKGYDVVDWRIRNLRGSGNGSTQPGNRPWVQEFKFNAEPDLIDTSSFKTHTQDPVYGFTLQQYYDDDTFTISDDGSIISLYARLRPTCELEENKGDVMKYFCTPNWLNSGEKCGLFGPRSNDIINFRRPELTLQSDSPISSGNGSQVEWPVRVASINNEYVSNAFLYIPPGTIQVTDVKNSLGNSISSSNNFYDLGIVAGASERNFTIEADYLTCSRDSVLVLLGWDCSDHPENIEDYSCDLDSLYLYVQPSLPAFNLAILKPEQEQEYELCSTIPFEFQYRNVGSAFAYNLNAAIFLPQASAAIDPGSLEIEYPCESGYTPWTGGNPIGIQVPLGTLWFLDITAQSITNNQIGPIGEAPDNGWVYPDINETDNCFNIRFTMTTECGFRSSREFVRTLLQGYGPCAIAGDRNGLVTGEIENAASIDIAGTDPYTMNLDLDMNNKVFACAEDEILEISLEMVGPGQTQPQDSIEIRLPEGIGYTGNNAGYTPFISQIDGLTSITFPINPQLSVGQRLDFEISFSLDAQLLECATNNITVKTFTIEEAHCITEPPGTTCPVYSTTSFENIEFEVGKPELGLKINAANAACGTGDLDVNYELVIINRSSEDIPADETFSVDIFANLDGSCSIFGENNLVHTAEISGPLASNESMTITGNLTFPFETCSMVAKINDCVCGDDGFDCATVEINDTPGNTYTSCYPMNQQIETCDRDDFTYQWRAIPPALDFWFDGPTDIYNPIINIPDPGLTVQTYFFEVSLDRGNSGCRSRDLVSITVTPEITYDAGPDKFICGTEFVLEGEIFGSIGAWSHESGPGNPVILEPNNPESQVTTLVPGTHVFRWSVVSDNDCSNGEFDEVTFTVLEQAEVEVVTRCTVIDTRSVYFYTIEFDGKGIPGTYSISGNDNIENLAYNILHGPFGPIPAENSTLNLFLDNDLGHCQQERILTEVDCPKFDFGDLPDTSAGTGSLNYLTLNDNNGPCHKIITDLSIKDFNDDEGDAQQSIDALGDGDDEDGFYFLSFLEAIKGAVYKLPLNIINETGTIAHFEVWIDWNSDGDFMDQDEFMYDLSDDGFGNFGTTVLDMEIPSHALENTPIGFRARLSHTNNMTPYGKLGSGEVEDYIFRVITNDDVCLPLLIQVDDQ